MLCYKNQIALLLLFLAFTATLAQAAPPRPVSEKPNVIFFMADELAYFEVGYMGNKYLKTPNIDKMAKEGIIFTNAYAGNCVCAPTRSTLMQGLHSGHSSVRDNGGGTPLCDEDITIAEMLKADGYTTGGFGKWGIGGRDSTGVPEKQGFDVFFGYYDQVHAHSYYTPYLIRNSEEVPLKGNVGGSEGETYSHYAIFDEGIKFIRENKDKPFFCYFPITPPHGIYDIPKTDPAYQQFADKPWTDAQKNYAAMVGMVDNNVGEVLELLKKLEIDKNTVFFFCGDNGGHRRLQNNEHPEGMFGPNQNPKTGVVFRGNKGNLYEGGLRIPMVAHWPGKIKGGQVSDFVWYFPDVLPTVAEITGAKAPKNIDGISIVPELLGEKAAGRKQKEHPYLYWEYNAMTAVRSGDYKAVCINKWSKPGDKKKKQWSLYNIKDDITEQNDLAAKEPKVLKRLIGYAEEAYTKNKSGSFTTQERHQRDRQAKYGFGKDAKQVNGKKKK